MSDILEQLLSESKPSEDDARETGRKAFEEALEHVKTFAKCIPDDKEDLADEKRDWAIEWDGALKRLWDALASARKLGAEAKIDQPVLLEFKNLNATSAHWKEEAQFNMTTKDVRADLSVVNSEVPLIVRQTGSTSGSAQSSSSEVVMMTRPDKNQGSPSTEQARDDRRETTLKGKPDDPECVQHDTPCDRCMAAAAPCWGVPGRVCQRCKLLSQRCTKSSGRGGLRTKRKRDADGDAEQVPKASKSQGLQTVQKRRVVSLPSKDAQDDNDIMEVIDGPSAISKGKQKAQPSRSSKLSVVISPKSITTQPKPSKPTIPAMPQPEMPNPTSNIPNEFLKKLGELESLALFASSEVKRAQAENKKAEGTLDVVLAEIHSFRTKYDL